MKEKGGSHNNRFYFRMGKVGKVVYGRIYVQFGHYLSEDLVGKGVDPPVVWLNLCYFDNDTEEKNNSRLLYESFLLSICNNRRL